MGFQPKPSNWLVLDETHHRVFMTDTSFTIELWSLALLVIGGTPLLVGNNHDCSGYLIWFMYSTITKGFTCHGRLRIGKRLGLNEAANADISSLQHLGPVLKKQRWKGPPIQTPNVEGQLLGFAPKRGIRTALRTLRTRPLRPCPYAKNVGWWMAQTKVVFKRSSNLSATQNARSSTKNSPYIIWFVSRFWHTVDKFNTDLFDADGCLEWSHIRRIFTIIALQIRKEVCIISDLHQGCHILKAAKQAQSTVIVENHRTQTRRLCIEFLAATCHSWQKWLRPLCNQGP